MPDEVLAAQLPSLPMAEHRLTQSVSPNGFTILDDTFNANPAGTRRALDALARHPVGDGGRRVVVTPGMYELGPRQVDENAAFATAAADGGDACHRGGQDQPDRARARRP